MGPWMFDLMAQIRAGFAGNDVVVDCPDSIEIPPDVAAALSVGVECPVKVASWSSPL